MTTPLPYNVKCWGGPCQELMVSTGLLQLYEFLLSTCTWRWTGSIYSNAGNGNCFKQVWSMSYTLTSWRFDYYVAWALDLGWANSSLSLLLFVCSTHMAGDDKLLYLVGSLTTACGICRYIGTTYDNYTYIYLYPYQQNSANSTKIIMCSNFHANIPLQGHKIKPSIYHLWERSHAHTHDYPCHEPIGLVCFQWKIIRIPHFSPISFS